MISSIFLPLESADGKVLAQVLQVLQPCRLAQIDDPFGDGARETKIEYVFEETALAVWQFGAARIVHGVGHLDVLAKTFLVCGIPRFHLLRGGHNDLALVGRVVNHVDLHDGAPVLHECQRGHLHVHIRRHQSIGRGLLWQVSISESFVHLAVHLLILVVVEVGELLHGDIRVGPLHHRLELLRVRLGHKFGLISPIELL